MAHTFCLEIDCGNGEVMNAEMTINILGNDFGKTKTFKNLNAYHPKLPALANLERHCRKVFENYYLLDVSETSKLFPDSQSFECSLADSICVCKQCKAFVDDGKVYIFTNLPYPLFEAAVNIFFKSTLAEYMGAMYLK